MHTFEVPAMESGKVNTGIKRSYRKRARPAQEPDAGSAPRAIRLDMKDADWVSLFPLISV